MSEEEQKYFKDLIGFTFDSDDIKYIEKIVDKKGKEIERLNNIINNYEKWVEEYISLLKEPDIYEEQTLEDLKEALDKLQELKGSDNNE